ncbi:hypothetical protein [Spirosoma litoris]
MTMDLDDFKQTWQAYDQKLEQTQQLGRQLLDIIQRERSKNSIDKMIRELQRVSVILLAIIVIFSAIVAGNPFDYTEPIHFAPALGYILLAVFGLISSRRHMNSLRQTTLFSDNLFRSLTELIRLREQHTRLMSRVWVLGMLAGAMIMLPTIARKYTESGWIATLLIGLFPLGLTLVSAWLAKVIGLFTDHYLNELREQVKELAESNESVDRA